MSNYHRGIRAQVNLSMLGGVLAIISGLAVPADATTLRHWLAFGIFCAGAIAGMFSSRKITRTSGEFVEVRVAKTVFLIWMPFPIVASMSAFGVAASFYDPIAHDGYESSRQTRHGSKRTAHPRRP